MDNSFLQARIDATKLQIVAYEDASTAISSGGIESYTLDTGQSRQTVTRVNIRTLQDAIEALYNRLAVLEARLSGSGSISVRPAW